MKLTEEEHKPVSSLNKPSLSSYHVPSTVLKAGERCEEELATGNALQSSETRITNNKPFDK